MCINPIVVGYRIVDGKYEFDWSNSQHYPLTMYLRCGRCIECETQRTREWAVRICLEAKHHVDNCCLTLTYSPEKVPGELVKKDVQDFLKRLFKNEHLKGVKRFYCGEYGSKYGRPHYHCILFGYRPPDLEYFFTRNGQHYFKSKIVDKNWQQGYVLVGDVNYNSAFYCAKYLQKTLQDNINDGRCKPFIEMSRRPGIGYNDAKYVDYDNDLIYCNGYYHKVPRYFDKVNFKDNVALSVIVPARRRAKFRNIGYIERCSIIKHKCIKYSKFSGRILKYY